MTGWATKHFVMCLTSTLFHVPPNPGAQIHKEQSVDSCIGTSVVNSLHQCIVPASLCHVSLTVRGCMLQCYTH